ncbi:MAG: DUF1592 domain-containing protein, partial [Pirellulaceae bacterium]|nr:DUF1592 domain-containing protein [Pirellulaceae bacterium]
AGLAQDQDAAALGTFLNSHCIRCHGPKTQKADRRFDRLSFDAAKSQDEAELLQEILDQLNLGEMPPEDAKQPSAEQTKRVVADLTAMLAEAREAAQQDAGKVVMRRLNRSEYRNTIRDLFGLKMIDFDPTTTFPPDESTAGFDNVGEGLVTSDYLLRNYLEAARQVADKAIRPGPRPALIHERLEGEEIGGARRGFGGEAARLFIKFRQPLGLTRLDKRRGVAADGEYVIRFTARAHQRKSRYRDEDLRYNSGEPMKLSISIDSRELGPTAHRIIGEYEIPDDRVVEIEHRVWLERGFTFHLHWANGPHGSFKRIMRKVLPKYTKDAVYPARNPPEMYIGSGPELHVYSVELEGPVYDEWPPAGFARFFPNPPMNPGPAYLDAALARLGEEAFRRPLTAAEMEPYQHLAQRYLKQHRDFWGAAKFGVRAILTSPNFLFLAESAPDKNGGRALSQHELATRLSYFLWSSMPDRELREAAEQGALSDPQAVRSQVKRMLRDPKSGSIADNFVSQWLGLRQLGEMPPDPEKNRSYYEDDLENAMRAETRLFFHHVLHGNRSVLEFVDSDYTFLNAALARHYGISGVVHDDMRKVSLTGEHHRGGLLGHGSILTATSNGVETRPVVRGIWILENLFGTPPNPPPPDIEPLEPDTRGVATIRQLMEKHRNNPTCFECHRRIDPLGLAMENFDHVGAWRRRYGKSLTIDASGELPDGTAISGPAGIKQHLLQRPNQFTRCLTEKLMVYALGRRLSFTDRDDIDQIVDAMPKHGYGLRELIQQVVASDAFGSK